MVARGSRTCGSNSQRSCNCVPGRTHFVLRIFGQFEFAFERLELPGMDHIPSCVPIVQR